MPVAPGTYNYVIAPWERRSLRLDGDGGSPRFKDRWVGPDGYVVGLDRRPRAAMAGTAPDGFGIFALDPAADIPSNALYLGNDLASASVASDSEIIARMGLDAGDLGRATLLDTLWAEMTELADPMFVDRGGPLMPGREGRIELRLHGHGLLRSESYDAARHPKALALARTLYARAAERDDYRSEEMTPAQTKALVVSSYLEALCRKFGVAPSQIAVPRGGASIEDTFAAGSNTAIGSWTPTPGGSGSWSQLNGTWSAYTASPGYAAQSTVTDPGSIRLNLDLASDDMTVTATADQQQDFDACGPLGRVSASATDYVGYSRDGSNSLSQELFTVVGGGTPTSVASVGNDYPPPAWPHDLILELDGSTATCTEVTTEKISTSIGATWDGNTRAGLYMDEALGNNGPYFDHIQAADIGGGGPVEVNLAGAMPAATGSLGVMYVKAVAGDMPAPAGELATEYEIGVAGDMPSASGALGSQSVVAVDLAGAMPAPSGALAAKYLIALAGDFPSPSGALAAKYLIALAGEMPAASAAVVSKEFVDLAGDMPASSGAIGSQSVVAVDVAGNMPASSGVLSGLYEIALSGDMPAAEGALALLYEVALSGDLPAMVGDLAVEQFIELAGDLPAMSGALAAVELGEFTPTPISGHGSSIRALTGGGSIGVISGTGRA